MALNRLCATGELLVPSLTDSRLYQLFTDARCIQALSVLCWLYSVVVSLVLWLGGHCVKVFLVSGMSFVYNCVDFDDAVFVYYIDFTYIYSAVCSVPYIVLFLLLRRYHGSASLSQHPVEKRQREELVLSIAIEGSQRFACWGQCIGREFPTRRTSVGGKRR